MGTIENAIEEFREKRLAVYQADQQQIVRDSRAAERAAKDHVGRWLFELLQNCDDAKASNVQIAIEGDDVYVADNGNGLQPDAVSAICGTDFSDKTTGTIGRKGVGFKSVYDVSNNPQVLTVNDGGIEFNLDKTREWLQKHKFDGEHIPHQWIPFFVSWNGQDSVLTELTDFKTIVVLRGVTPEQRDRVVQLLEEWPPHALFTFRHVRTIKTPELEIRLTPGHDIWSMQDSRGQTPKDWRVATHTDQPPENLLVNLSVEELKAVKKDGVGFLIAAPIGEDGVVPTEDYLPIHVFYPTEEKGSIRLLLHAEFLVKSDRTALMPVDGSPFNAWVAERLACHICEFVNGAYRQGSPSSHLALLVPFDDRESHAVAQALWQRIVKEAKGDLRLADAEGQQRLLVGEARLISASIHRNLARRILEATDVRVQLLHRSFDEDKEARKALKELDCAEIHDQDLLKTIAKATESHAADIEWVRTCWEWLSDWVGKEPYGDKHKERVETVRSLPIVPIGGQLRKPSDLMGRIVTWRADSQENDLPEWLPLTFVDEWFRDRIQATSEQENAVRKLCEELDIKEPGTDVVQRAAGQAIKQYWKDRSGDPGQFLRFIREQDWHETSVASSALQRCPVPLGQPVQNEAWAEAGKAYFGREWGNELLVDLYDGIEAVAWIRKEGADDSQEELRNVLKWLGVAECPRAVGDPSRTTCETRRVTKILPYHTAHDTIPAPKVLEHVDIADLQSTQTIALVRLLARHWSSYYAHVSTTDVRYRYYGWYPHSVDSFWWDEAKTKLRIPLRRSPDIAPLISCWLPDKRTDRALGDLLPGVNLDVFEDDKDAVRDWLVSTVRLRMQIEQVTMEEWKKLLSTRISEKAPARRLPSEDRLCDKVTGWYAACLEAVVETEDGTANAFASCPLLCRKGDLWEYVAEEKRYLDDDNDLAKAFAGDVWLFHIPARLAPDAVKYFGVLSLFKHVHVQIEPGESKTPLPDELQQRFHESLPYVWAWRSSQSKQDTDRLSSSLKKLDVHVVPALNANLDLDGVHHEAERRWHVADDTLFLHTDHANEAELAQALARAVGAKSEADFYENLLRCDSNAQRKEKLLSKDIADAEVERYLREYSGHSEEPPSEQPEPAVKEPAPEPPTETPAETPQPKPTGGESPGGETAPKLGQPKDTAKQPLCLKDAQTVAYKIGSAPVPGGETEGSGGGGETSSHGTHTLTEDEKLELEEAGRRIAVRELKKTGYSVEKMPQDNPGFDLRGTRTDEELRVEVKAHTGRATVVDVTQRQYKEYLGQQGYRWELWNVDHLANNDPEPPAITRYDDIPDDALDARTFRVDLKKCQSPTNPSLDPE